MIPHYFSVLLLRTDLVAPFRMDVTRWLRHPAPVLPPEARVTRAIHRAALIAGVTLFGLAVGCGQKSENGASQDAMPPESNASFGKDVDPHDVPLTDQQKETLRAETAEFADAVARVKKLRDVIQKETQAGLPENPLAAHQALDQVDLVVQWLPRIAKESGIAKEHWEAINTAANQLREQFEKVHENIDNKKDPDFASVARPLDTEIAALEAIPQ